MRYVLTEECGALFDNPIYHNPGALIGSFKATTFLLFSVDRPFLSV
jgi:hypothetical protein